MSDKRDPLNAAEIYERLAADRENYLDRARENARLTLPHLMTEEGHTSSSRIDDPYSSIGARCVNSLAAKIESTILPHNVPFFYHQLSDDAVEDLGGNEALRNEVDLRLNARERKIVTEIEDLAIRPIISTAVKHLLVSGNFLILIPQKGVVKGFKLDRYVVQRDSEGNLLKVIIREDISLDALPDEAKRILMQADDGISEDQRLPSERLGKKDQKVVYTVYYRDGNRVRTYQSIDGWVIKGTEGSYSLETAPVMPLRWTSMFEEDYGRSYVEEYIGDLNACEHYERALRYAAAAASKVNFLVNPAGLTRAQDVAGAANLAIISGRAEDVTSLQMDKQPDMAFVQEQQFKVINRLSHAFFLHQSVQRDAERVTKYEIQTMISELDDVLGGVYSLLAQTLQRPMLVRVIKRMERQKKIPPLSDLKGPDGKPVAEPVLITGVEAIGQGHSYNRLQSFVNDLVVPLASAFKETIMPELDFRGLLHRGAVGMSIDPDGIIKSEEQKAEDLAKAEAMQNRAATRQALADAAGKSGPEVAKAYFQQGGDEETNDNE